MYIDHRIPLHDNYFSKIVKALIHRSIFHSVSRSLALKERRRVQDSKIFKYGGVYYVLYRDDFYSLRGRILLAEKVGDFK